ncbi:MAG: hypothetical protein KDK33_11220 [Leptospiraceae bacterium]|nr:hypothetical protein [Leptospiraceae bacterium]
MSFFRRFFRRWNSIDRSYRDEAYRLVAASLISLAVVVGCSSADQVSGGEEFEGWRQEEGIDVFYIRRSGHASEKALSSENTAMLQSTCMEAARLQAMDALIRKMVGETIEAQSGVLDGQTTGVAVNSIRNGIIKGDVVQKECADRGQENDWDTCECVFFVKGKDLRKKVELEVTKATSG